MSTHVVIQQGQVPTAAVQALDQGSTHAHVISVAVAVIVVVAATKPVLPHHDLVLGQLLEQRDAQQQPGEARGRRRSRSVAAGASAAVRVLVQQAPEVGVLAALEEVLPDNHKLLQVPALW